MYCYIKKYIVELVKADYVNKTNPVVVQIIKTRRKSSCDIHHHDVHYDSGV